MILVVATLPNRTPDSWYANRRRGQPGYPRQSAWARGNGWINAPSGGKLSSGVVDRAPHTYNSRGFGSNTGGN